jgi:hypothetical protein
MSPDLFVVVRSSTLTRRRAQAIADSSWPADALLVRPGAKRWWRLTRTGHLPGELFIGAHDILADSADWHAATWGFEPHGLARFEKTLRRLYELLPEKFTIEASWVGDSVTRDEVVTRQELVRLVAANRLGNRVRYQVGAEGDRKESAATHKSG